MKQKRLTMQDIAQKAGVSVTTVSHVINKTRHVNQETREAVLQTIKEINYRSLKLQKGNLNKHTCIGVIIADIREDYYVDILKSIETVATDLGISVIFCDSEVDAEKEVKNISLLVERNVSGLILAPIESEYVPPVLQSITIPVVLIDRQYELHNFLFIGINNFKSSFLGTEYLLEKGCKKIGFIGYSDSVYTIKQRILGFRACMVARNYSIAPKTLSLNYDKEDSFPLIKQFIENEQLDGIVCATSTICYEVVDVLATIDENVSPQVRVISYDDNRWLDFIKFPVSVISQPVAEIGTAAIENIMQLIEQPEYMHDIKRELLFDVNIIDRLK